MDPPLRSRLQCRYVKEPSEEELFGSMFSYYGKEVTSKALNSLNSLKTISNQKDVDLPRVQSSVSLAYFLADSLQRRGEAVDIAELVERSICGGRKQYGEGLRRLFGKGKTESDEEFAKSFHACVLIGDKGCGRKHKALQMSKLRKSFIEIMSLTPDMSSVELFQTRSGSDEETVYIDTPLTRAMRNGYTCLLDGLENTPQFVPIFQRLLERMELLCPDGTHFVSEQKYAYLMSQYSVAELEPLKVCVIHHKFALVGMLSREDALSSPWLVPPFLSLPLPELSTEELEKVLMDYLPAGMPRDVASSVARFLCELRNLKKGKKSLNVEFSISNAINCVKLCGKIHPRTNIKDCTLYRFQSSTTQKDMDHLLEISGLSSLELEEVEHQTTDKKVHDSSHLVPDVRYFENESAEQVIDKIVHYIAKDSPLLLVGLQGVGKNLLVDHALQKLNYPRQYQQLHRDTTVSTLWSTRSIEDGKITFQSSPLLTAIEEGHCIVLDEIDKASLAVIATLKALVGGVFRMTDGRVVVSAAFRQNVPKELLNDAIIIHENFRLVLLANPGVAPFLGANVLRSVGHFANAICVDPPNLNSMISILNAYNKEGQSSPQMIESIARSFSDLLSMNLSGKLQYSYGLREAISVVKDLRLTNDLEMSLKNVFDYEIPNQTRQSIKKVFSSHGIELKEFGSVGNVSDKEKVSGNILCVVCVCGPNFEIFLSVKEYTRHSGEKSMGPKHGKASDGKQHVGGNTWQGGTGGRDTAGMGGKHGPYRVFGGHDVHQLSDEEKQWKDKEMEQKARQMANDALQAKLKEIEMGKVQYDVYNEYLNNISSYLPALQNIVKNIKPNKERRWITGQSEGDLDETRLVDALAGERNVYKRKGKKEQSKNLQNSSGNFYMRFVLDASASMYRFNHIDQRLVRTLEACLLLLEGLSEADLTRIHYGIYAHTGEEMMIKLVDSDDGDIPKNIKERFQVLERIVSRSQYTWSGDMTLEAAERAIHDLEMKGNENDERRMFIFSDANFRRYRISPHSFLEILKESEKVQSTAILMGQIGSEAENIQRVLGEKAFICFETSQIIDILSQQLRSTLQSSHL